MDLRDSLIANDSSDRAPFAFEGTLKRVHFTSLPVEQKALAPSPDDDRGSTRRAL